MRPEIRKAIDEHIGKLELRGTQVWMAYEAIPWGLKWRPIIDLEPLVRMVRDGVNEYTSEPEVTP